MPNSLNAVVKKVSVVASALGAGVLAGLMLAPKSGKDTRKDIKNKIDETKEKIETKANEVKGDIIEKGQEVKGDVKAKVDEFRKPV